MKNYQRLKGMVAATFTPFNTDGELNLPIISQYADQMATSQMAGVFVCGTTGESLSLTVEERKAVLEAWVKATKRRFKVIAHVGTNSIHEGVELAKHAQECGAGGRRVIAYEFGSGSVSQSVPLWHERNHSAMDGTDSRINEGWNRLHAYRGGICFLSGNIADSIGFA